MRHIALILVLFLPFSACEIPIRFMMGDFSCDDPKSFTRIPQSRIVGGDPTHIKRYPFIVSIQFKRVLTRHVCGGSILNPKWILTAAHCVVAKGTDKVQFASKFVVLAGLTNCRSVSYWAAVTEIQSVYKHAQYDKSKIYNDIALMKLARPMKMDFNKVPTKLSPLTRYTKGEEPSDYFTHCIAIGWGATKEKGKPSDVLRVVELPLLSYDRCTRLLFRGSYLRHTQVCTLHWTSGKDACQGDSGGPLVCGGEQIGLTSWGTGCGRINTPGVWTRVDQYRSWMSGIQDYSSNMFRSGATTITPIFNMTLVIILLFIMMQLI